MKLSSLVLGTFPFASVFTQIDTGKVKEIIKKYLDLGGNFLDTAPIYAFGAVEEMLGGLISDFGREKLSIGTKCGYVWDEKKTLSKSGSAVNIKRELEKSLKRLRVDYIDVYMSHTPDTNTPFDETIQTLENLKSEGKIKDLGVSNVSLDQLKSYNRHGSVRFVQNRFSYLNRSLANDFLAYCKANSIQITAYQVIERGLLTSKFLDGKALRDGDLRNNKPEFSLNVRGEITKWVNAEISPIASRLNIPISALAIWWILQQSPVDFAVLGTTNVDQLIDNFTALKIGDVPAIRTEMDYKYQIFEQKIQEKYSQSIAQFMGIA